MTSVRLSPNGDRFAFLQLVQREVCVDDDGSPYHELHIVDLEGNSTPYITGKVDIGNIAWAPDGNSLCFVTKRDPDARFNSIWSIPVGGGEARNDLVDAKTYLVNAGIADGDRVGISGGSYGGSYGGYASMWGATALSEEFAASVAFVGISNQTSKFGTGDIPYGMYYVHSLAWPWEDWMWMLQRSPIYHAGNAKTPLLILGGDKDPWVHPSQSLEMYRHVKLRTDTPVRLVIYPGEAHGNRNSAARYDYSLRSKRLMDHYLKGPGGEPPPYDIGHAERMQQATED